MTHKLKSILKKGKSKKRKQVTFAKPIKTVLIIERRNKGEPVNVTSISKIKDDLTLSIKSENLLTQVDIQSNILTFLKTLDLQFFDSTIVYNQRSKILYIQSVLQHIKKTKQLSIVPFKHKTRDLFIINPHYKSIEWLSCIYNIDKELFKKLKEVFKTIGYHLVNPTILPQPCTEFMLFFVDFKSKNPLLNHKAFHFKFNRLDNNLVKKQILNLNFKLTNSSSYQSKISKLHTMTPDEIHKLYQKLI